MRSRRVAVVTAVLLSVGLAGCPGGPAIQPLTKTVEPVTASVALLRGVIDSDPGCVAGATAHPSPQTWWNSLQVGQSPRAVGEGVVGFHLWANPTGTCQGFRQDLYRTLFAYDLSSVTAQKGLVTKATLSVNAKILPPTRPTGFGCEAFTAGGGGMVRLPSGTALPPGGFEQLAPTQGFPAGPVVFSFPQPWQAGQIAPGVSSFDGGGQRASFSVDVTQDVNQALNSGSNRIVFAISGSDEAARTIRPPSGEFDCRTTYSVSSLAISHL